MQSDNHIVASRILCLVCAAYTAGISIFALFSPSIAIVAAISAIFIIAAALKKLPYFFTLLIVCLSFFAGVTHFRIVKSADEKFVNQYTGRYLTLSGKITDISIVDGGFQNITVSVSSLSSLGKTEKKSFSASIFTDTQKTFSVGDIITFSDILSPDKKSASHGFNYDRYLHSKGISASFSPSTNYITITGKDSGFFSNLRILSKNLSQKMQHFIGGDEGAVAAAITLGDSAALSDRLNDLFRKGGISHVVAVSGMHLSILIFFFFSIAGRLRLNYKIRNAIGIVLVIFYMLLTGLSPSITRAGIMMVCILFSAIIDRKNDMATSLFLSAAIILIINPYTIFSASFLLSYLSLAGIIVFSPYIRSMLSRLHFLPNFISDITASSFGAWLFTFPALSIMFNGISLVSLAVNIAVLPLLNIIFAFSLITLLVGLVFPPVATILGIIPNLLIKTVIICTKGITALPYSYVNIATPGILDFICFAIVIVLLYCIFTGRKIGKPGLFSVCFVVAYFAFSFTCSSFTYSVTFLDIGQGDCILIKTPGNHNYLIDTGPNANTTLSALRSSGVNSLDALFISHSDKDHSGALDDVLSEFPTDKLILPNYDIRGEKINALISTSLSSGTDVEFADRFSNYTFSGISADILWPPTTDPGPDMENENSLVLMLNVKGNRFLFTGDIDSGAENDIIKNGEIVDADILKAAHHGSDTSCSEAFLKKVSAEYAVICAGNGNPYGHPHEDTLARLENSGSKILRTDKMGDIKFTIDLFGNMRVKYETK